MKIKILVLSILFLILFPSQIFAESIYSIQDVNAHSAPGDCWMIFDDGVYDISAYLPNHDIYMDIREWCGKDMTEDFMTKDGMGIDHKPFSYNLLASYYIGAYDNTEALVITPIVDLEEDHEEEYSVEISGQEIKTLTVQEVADLWDIDADYYLAALVSEFNLLQDYTVDDILDTLRDEYKFSPSLAKEVAQSVADSGYSSNDNSSPDQADVGLIDSNPYNFFVPFLLSLSLYTVWFFLTKSTLSKYYKAFTRVFFNMFWNSVLLVTVSITGLIFGFLMILRYSNPDLVSALNYDFIYYWHVELSVVMATIAIAHFVNRFTLYKNQLKISFKKDKK